MEKRKLSTVCGRKLKESDLPHTLGRMSKARQTGAGMAHPKLGSVRVQELAVGVQAFTHETYSNKPLTGQERKLCTILNILNVVGATVSPQAREGHTQGLWAVLKRTSC